MDRTAGSSGLTHWGASGGVPEPAILRTPQRGSPHNRSLTPSTAAAPVPRRLQRTFPQARRPPFLHNVPVLCSLDLPMLCTS